MKVTPHTQSRVRIEMLPLIDIVFLLLVFFIYAMLSMAVHHGLPVRLPSSTTSEIEKQLTLSVTVKKDGRIYVNREPVPLETLPAVLRAHAASAAARGVLLFADSDLHYQDLFHVLDQIRRAGLTRISLQTEENPKP
jgi:biopolymer transport protein ExbD